MVTEFVNPINLQTNPTYSQRICVFAKDGTAMCSLDLDNDNNDARCYTDGFGAASPAIGKITVDGTGNTKSNLVVLTENGWNNSIGSPGKIKIYHVAEVSSVLTLVEDYSLTATIQSSCGADEKSIDGFISSPCIGDLDGDGQKEVVAYSRDGELYVIDYISSSFVAYTGQVVSCADRNFVCSNAKGSGPILTDIDGDNGTYPDLEIVLAAFPPSAGGSPYLYVYDYDSSAEDKISQLFQIELDDYAVATICAGRMDAADHVDVLAQAYSYGGLVWAYQFDNSTFSTIGWSCECGNAARTSCAD